VQVVVLANNAFEVNFLPGAVNRPIGVEISIGQAGYTVKVLIQAKITGRDTAAEIERGKGQVSRRVSFTYWERD